MKQAEIAAQSSGAKGGDSRVFEAPLFGVLAVMAMATVLKASFPDRLTRRSIRREMTDFTTR